jgi:hypothetical protein
MDTYRRRQERTEAADYETPEVIIQRRLRTGETIDTITADLVRKALRPGYDFYDIIPDVIKMRAAKGDERMQELLELGEFQTEGYAIDELLRTANPILHHGQYDADENKVGLLDERIKPGFPIIGFISKVRKMYSGGTWTSESDFEYDTMNHILLVHEGPEQQFTNILGPWTGNRGSTNPEEPWIEYHWEGLSPEDIVRKVLEYRDPTQK